jgi:hypothetical protein
MSTSDHEPDASGAGFDRDDDLRALLRSGDPARSLSPADPAALASLLEDIMSADLDVRPTQHDHDSGDRAAGARGRNRVTWLVAAAAAAVIAGVGGYAVSGLGGDGSQVPAARDTASPGSGDASLAAGAPLAGVTTELTGQGAVGRCAAPDPSFIATGTQAFEGTVTSIEGDTVTLEATDVFTGEVGQTVQVTAPPAQFGALIQAVDFKEGQTYLVSATDGMVAVCGNSGPATGQLRSLYDQAFVR